MIRVSFAEVSYAYAPGHTCIVKDVIQKPRASSSIVLWFSSDAHVPIVGALGGGQSVPTNLLFTASYNTLSA